MNVEETIRVALINFPGIFPNALSVYNRLFCTGGNGYEWKDGELCSVGGYSADIKGAVIKAVESGYQLLLNTQPRDLEVYKKTVEFNRSETVKNINLIFDTSSRLTDFTPASDFQFSEITKYSKILNLPSDITPDWLDAAKWMYLLLSQYSHRIHNFKPEMLIWVDESIKKVGR